MSHPCCAGSVHRPGFAAAENGGLWQAARPIRRDGGVSFFLLPWLSFGLWVLYSLRCRGQRRIPVTDAVRAAQHEKEVDRKADVKRRREDIVMRGIRCGDARLSEKKDERRRDHGKNDFQQDEVEGPEVRGRTKDSRTLWQWTRYRCS